MSHTGIPELHFYDPCEDFMGHKMRISFHFASLNGSQCWWCWTLYTGHESVKSHKEFIIFNYCVLWTHLANESNSVLCKKILENLHRNFSQRIARSSSMAFSRSVSVSGHSAVTIPIHISPLARCVASVQLNCYQNNGN